MKSKKKINWTEFLARNPFTITQPEWREYVNATLSWTTCAVGNQCECIPRDWSKSPEDPELRKLGVDFYHDVVEFRKYTNKFHAAPIDSIQSKECAKNVFIYRQFVIDTLKKIEQRTAKIIEDIQKEAVNK